MSDFSIRTGDRSPVLLATLRNSDASAVDLTNATSAALRMRRRDSTSLAINSAPMTFASPRTSGQVSYAWAAADVEAADFAAYWADVLVSWNDGSTQSFPTPDFLTVEVVGGLADWPTITDAQLATIRGKIGSSTPPTDADLARSLTRLGSTDAVILEILNARLADLMSAGSVSFSVVGEYSQDSSANAQWLADEVARARTAVAGGAGTLTVGQIARSDRPR